jgi:MFS transporter, UMF1 family
MNKKQIFLWGLYDFANSIVTGVFALYFSQWLVVDNKVSDLWYNLIFVGASILLVFAGPVGGAIADKTNRQLFFIRISTIAQYAFGFITAYITIFVAPSPFAALAAALSFMAILFFYQFSLGFYNALLPQLGPSERHGRISGFGQFMNWLGQVVGLMATLPFITGAIHFFGIPGRGQPLFPAVILFMIFSLPMLIWFKEIGERHIVAYSIRREFKNYWQGFKKIWVIPGVALFLAGFFFFNDALLTTANNFPIYLQQLFGVADSVKAYLAAGIMATSAIGGLVGGWLGDKFGLKKTFVAIVAIWIFFFPTLGVVTDFSVFIVMTVIMGTLYGATWSVARAVMAALLPVSELNRGFSYYTLSERFSTLIGPVTWGLIVTGAISLGAARYQLAAIAMSVFVLAGFMLFRKVPLER